ncbi:MAG: hypothetical protein WBX18_00725, partial [Terracidiphilus sp.]
GKRARILTEINRLPQSTLRSPAKSAEFRPSKMDSDELFPDWARKSVLAAQSCSFALDSSLL